MNIRLLCLLGYLILCTPLLSQKPSGGPPNNPEEFEELYNWRIRQERLDGVYIPKSLEDALNELDRLTDQESRDKFASLPEDEVFRRFFNSLRLWIVHNWGLTLGSRLGHLFRPLNLRHPDDIAEVLIVAWHRRLNKRPIELKQLVEGVRENRKEKWRQLQEKQRGGN